MDCSTFLKNLEGILNKILMIGKTKIIRHFQEENQDIKVLEELEGAAKSNKFIRIYLDNIKRTEENREKHKSEPERYRDIVDEVLNSKPFSFFKKRKLKPEEVNQIAERLSTETNKSNIEKLLDIFDYHKFPFESELILNFAKQKPTSKNKIAEKAIDALKHLKSKNIRNFAVDKILNSRYPIDYLEILISNYRQGDFKMLSDIASKTKGPVTHARKIPKPLCREYIRLVSLSYQAVTVFDFR